MLQATNFTDDKPAFAAELMRREELQWITVAPGAPYFTTESGTAWTPIGQNDAITWPELRDYLSNFTAWRPYEHRVLAEVDGMQLPIPINLDTINRLYGLSLTSIELEGWLAARAKPIEEIRTAEDVVVSTIGREL